MKNETRRAAGILLNKIGNPVIAYLFQTRVGPTEAHIERDLAKEYGRIADRMAGRPKGEVPCPLDPELASRITREVFEEARREAKEGETPDEEKIKRRVMSKLGLE